MNCMYRKGSLHDCRQVYQLICEMECSELPFEKFAEIYQKQLQDKRYYCLVCKQDEKVIGVLNLRFEEQLHHAECIAEILEFAVDSSYRKRGIGKEMLGFASNLAKEAGCTQIEVACNKLRTDTHRFYFREKMNNFHFKFSKVLTGEGVMENRIGV